MAAPIDPVAEFLTSGQVAAMMGMRPSTWKEFLANNPQFPKPVVIGKTKTGREIRRFKRVEVQAYIALCRG